MRQPTHEGRRIGQCSAWGEKSLGVKFRANPLRHRDAIQDGIFHPQRLECLPDFADMLFTVWARGTVETARFAPVAPDLSSLNLAP